MLQVMVMVAGVLVILVTAVVEVGGLGRVWEVARQHGRVELLNECEDAGVCMHSRLKNPPQCR
ncbi:Sodium-dependent multivitamin transporter [Portunus trituberculatus]|uniref:Sodium-dependent multivitamin transporter n=1 Tax=Portunus trituberculatus TaxID=210409 RepID=A0A5B7I9I5_PORTR|nr:Sodium-dependent multivitamin transporter [Portunus trituberculatus]